MKAPAFVAACAGLLLSGCVRQSLTIKTEPAEALVYVNDELKGKSPVTYDFEWYGWHRVMIRKEGYTPVIEKKLLKAPVYLWIPLDLVMELLPFPVRDTRIWSYALAETPKLATPAPPVETLTLPMEGAPPTPAAKPAPALTDRPVLSIDAAKEPGAADATTR